MKSGQIEIYTEWDEYGFIATSPDYPGQKSVHCAGPRDAAENLCVGLFGIHYEIKFVRRGHYLVTQKP
jgi:hypothetical protein